MLELLIPGTQVMGWSQNHAEDAAGSPTVQVQRATFLGSLIRIGRSSYTDPILGQIVIKPAARCDWGSQDLDGRL